MSWLRRARKAAIAVVGFSVLALGVALLVLPGPALLVIPLGLTILGTEFRWAHELLERLRGGLHRLKARAQRRLGPRPLPAATKTAP